MSVVPATLACMVNDTGRIDSRESLIRALHAGSTVRYLYFWGHRPRPDGHVGPSCLSQWWPSPFVVDGVAYATAEHWMMAGKARLFADAEAERRVLAAEHPAEAKKAGRLVRDFDEATWERERFGIVVEGSVHKFSSDPALREFLVHTGSGCWWRPARWTGSGASGSRRTTRRRATRSGGGGRTCWGSR